MCLLSLSHFKLCDLFLIATQVKQLVLRLCMHLGLVEYVHTKKLVGLTHSKFVERLHQFEVDKRYKPIIEGQGEHSQALDSELPELA